MFALAHATGKVGRFTLIEKWRNNERLLAPNENPLKILMKWGEYSSDVQFMLQRSDQLANNKSPVSDLKAALATRNAQKSAVAAAAATPVIADISIHQHPLDTGKELRKHFAADPANVVSPRMADNVGIVRGIPQAAAPSAERNNNISTQNQQQHHRSNQSQQLPYQHQHLLHHHQTDPSISSTTSNATTISCGSNTSATTDSSSHQLQTSSAGLNNAAATSVSPPLTPIEFNTADVRNALDRKTSSSSATAGALIDDSAATAAQPNSPIHPATMLYAQGPAISSNGALVPPPYRDPPPPRASPCGPPSVAASAMSPPTGAFADALHHRFDSAALNTAFVHVKDLADAALNPDAAAGVIFHNAQYRELVQLIKFQREKLTVQQADLGKFDAEIGYLELREREQLQQLDVMAREIGKADQQFRHGQEQLQSLQYVEEENELVHQQEKTLKSEITLLRSKLANCETELLQYKNKVRLLLDDLQVEQQQQQQHHQQQQFATVGNPKLERHFMSEVERIQAEIDQAVLMAETAHQTADHLKQDVASIESTIAEKKKQVEQLVNEMKEVNLQSLTAVAPSDEIRHLLEGELRSHTERSYNVRSDGADYNVAPVSGSSRPGSTRRIIGSPRQLENAVPTSKNPHGVWV